MNHEVLKRFIDRVRQSQRGQSKQVILSFSEAQDMANSLADLLINQNDLQQQIIKLQAEQAPVQIALHGGTFAN